MVRRRTLIRLFLLLLILVIISFVSASLIFPSSQTISEEELVYDLNGLIIPKQSLDDLSSAPLPPVFNLCSIKQDKCVVLQRIENG